MLIEISQEGGFTNSAKKPNVIVAGSHKDGLDCVNEGASHPGMQHFTPHFSPHLGGF